MNWEKWWLLNSTSGLLFEATETKNFINVIFFLAKTDVLNKQVFWKYFDFQFFPTLWNMKQFYKSF